MGLGRLAIVPPLAALDRLKRGGQKPPRVWPKTKLKTVYEKFTTALRSFGPRTVLVQFYH